MSVLHVHFHFEMANQQSIVVGTALDCADAFDGEWECDIVIACCHMFF